MVALKPTRGQGDGRQPRSGAGCEGQRERAGQGARGQLVVRMVVCQGSESAKDGAAVLKKRIRIEGTSPRDTASSPALQGRLFGVIIPLPPSPRFQGGHKYASVTVQPFGQN